MKLNQPIKGTENINLKPAIILLSIAAVLLGVYLIVGFATLKQTTTTAEITCSESYISTDGTYCDGEHGGKVEPIVTTDENGNSVETYVGPVK